MIGPAAVWINASKNRGFDRLATAAAGMVVAVLVGSCASPGAPTAEPSGSTAGVSTPLGAPVIPWTDATPTPEPSPTPAVIPPGTPACTAGDLTATSHWGGATGSLAGGITVTNVGGVRCVLDGPPRLVTLRTTSQSLPVSFRAVAARAPGTAAETPSGPAMLGLGGQASAFMIWSNWCGSPEVQPWMLVTLPDGSGPLAIGRDRPESGGLLPRCDALGSPSAFSAWSFAVVPPPPPNMEPVTGRVVISAPPMAAPGQVITFTVSLTNLGNRAAPLEPCPTYTEDLVVNGAALKPPAARDYLLACGAIGPVLAAGTTVVLQMRYQIPADVGPGSADLLWRMDPGSPFDANSVIARAPLSISTP